MILETLLPQLEFQSNIKDAVKQKMIKSRRQVEEIAATAYSSNDFDFLLCKRMPLTRLVVVVYRTEYKDDPSAVWAQSRTADTYCELDGRKSHNIVV